MLAGTDIARALQIDNDLEFGVHDEAKYGEITS